MRRSQGDMLRRYDIQQLYKLLRVMQYQPQQFPANADTPTAQALYVLQQTVNGISLGCVYALIAIGYTLVYGITRVINFAFGEIYMIWRPGGLLAHRDPTIRLHGKGKARAAPKIRETVAAK